MITDTQKRIIQVELDKFKPRPYQIPIINALFKYNYKRMLVVLPRRGGKDIIGFNCILRAGLRRTGLYYYLLPTAGQARRVIFDGYTIDSQRILDYIPPILTRSRHVQEQKVTLINGSQIVLFGSDNYERLIGTNPLGVVFSEWSRSNKKAYEFLRPALTASGGWAMFISTPFGKNHMYTMYEVAKRSPEWFCYLKTLDETKHISREFVEREIEMGEMSHDLALQEYYCSFDHGSAHAYYAKTMNDLNNNGHICDVPWEPNFPVFSSWDLGIHDATTVIMYQVIGKSVRIIDCYEDNNKGLLHYINVIRNKPYHYETHFAPHDMLVREFTSGEKRLDTAREMGINFHVLKRPPNLMDDIEMVRSKLNICWFDSEKTRPLVRALENYHQEWDERRDIGLGRPAKGKWNHFCFDGDTLISTSNGKVPIRDCVEGMLVKTPLGYRKIVKVHAREVDSLLKVSTNTGELLTTPEHKIFTNKSIVTADALRYNDRLEHESLYRGFVWKKIFGYLSVDTGLKEFKKSIMSLKMNRGSSLMDTCIDGMEDTILHRPIREKKDRHIGRYGQKIMDLFQRGCTYIISMITKKITGFPTLSSCQHQSTLNITQEEKVHGHSQTSVRGSCLKLPYRPQKNGILQMKEGSGTSFMHIKHCRLLSEKPMRKDVNHVKETMKRDRSLGNIVVTTVNQNGVGLLKKTIIKGLVASAKIHSFVTNTLLKRHAVKDVQYLQLQKPRKVYDLTIEDDNCYYANGYLVSNCDSFRYMCQSLPYIGNEVTPEELERRYQEVAYGKSIQGEFDEPSLQSPTPPIFKNPFSR